MNIEEIRARESLISRLTCFMNGGYTPYDTIRSMCQDSINTINRLTSEIEQKNRELEGCVKLPAGHIKDRITEPNANYNAYGIQSLCYVGYDNSCKMPHCHGCPIRKMYIVMQDIENQAEAALSALEVE